MSKKIERNSHSEKSAIGWQTIKTLENGVSEIETVIQEEPLSPEILAALEAQSRANNALRLVLIYSVSEIGYN